MSYCIAVAQGRTRDKNCQMCTASATKSTSKRRHRGFVARHQCECPKTEKGNTIRQLRSNKNKRVPRKNTSTTTRTNVRTIHYLLHISYAGNKIYSPTQQCDKMSPPPPPLRKDISPRKLAARKRANTRPGSSAIRSAGFFDWPLRQSMTRPRHHCQRPRLRRPRQGHDLRSPAPRTSRRRQRNTKHSVVTPYRTSFLPELPGGYARSALPLLNTAYSTLRKAAFEHVVGVVNTRARGRVSGCCLEGSTSI